MTQLSTIQQVNSAIMFGTWTDAELTSMIDAIRFAKSNLQKQVKRSLSIGAQVKWHSPKRGITSIGKVEKIAVKYISVRDQSNLLWRVPANMLEIV